MLKRLRGQNGQMVMCVKQIATACFEINSVVHGRHVYKSEWLPVIVE